MPSKLGGAPAGDRRSPLRKWWVPGYALGALSIAVLLFLRQMKRQ